MVPNANLKRNQEITQAIWLAGCHHPGHLTAMQTPKMVSAPRNITLG